jgi:DNA-nicking Smr family endonuclease
MSKKAKGFNTPFSKIGGDKKSAKAAPPAPPPPPKPPPKEDDNLVFARAMAGVRPVDPRDRIEPPKTLEPTGPDDEALALAELESFVRGEGSFDMSDTGEVVSGRAPGVNDDLLKRLEKGDFSFRLHLDLHGRSREEAHLELGRFIAGARRDGERCVLVVTGRGNGSPDGVSVLRDATPRWLSRAPIVAHVLAFCTARRVDGGPGAYYVLLRRPGVKPYGAGVEPAGE